MNLDYSPLSAPVSFADKWTSLKNTITQKSASSKIGYALTVMIICGMTLSVIQSSLQNPSVNRFAFVTVCVAIILIVIIGAIFIILNSQTSKVQLSKFITANQLTSVVFDQQNEPGLLFNIGYACNYTGFAIPQANELQIANYEYTVGGGSSKKTYQYGVIRCKLDKKLPNVFFDATSNNTLGFSNFSELRNNQQLSMEGDFDKYFKVYVPSDYQTDTLYWLTPELMQLLKEHMSNFDIEIVDNYLYAYHSAKFKFNAQEIPSLIQIGQWLLAQFNQNTKNYKDSRTATADLIAQSGQRLKRSTTLITLIIVTICILFYTIMLATGNIPDS